MAQHVSKKIADGVLVAGERSINSIIVRLTTRLKLGPVATGWVWLFAFLGLVSPTVINYSPYPLAWDESYYLGRVICTNQAVYDFSFSSLRDCLATTHKGPIMGLVNLPWGPAGGTERGIGLAFVGLAIFIWILVLTTYVTCVHSGIPPGPLLLAAATIALTPFLRASSGAMMTDTLLGWSIALALMLIPLEYSRPSTGIWPSILRGLFWSLVIDVGMLSKMTFAFFFCVIGVALLVIRTDYSGERPFWCALAACAVGSAPTILILRYYGINLLGFAFIAAWSGTAGLWNVPGMTPAGYTGRYFSQLGLAIIPLLILLGMFIRGFIKEKQLRLARLLPIGTILIYLAIAAKSHNRDPRFTIPVMIAMPLCLAWTGIRKEAKPIAVGREPIVAALLVGTLLALPMIVRPQVRPILRAGALLWFLCRDNPVQGRPTRIVIASDGPDFNINTFLLAEQLRRDNLRPAGLDTLVYDAINKRPLDEGFSRIDSADYVLFLKPSLPQGADWSRVYAQDYRAHCQRVGTLMAGQISPDLDVFKIRKAAAQ